VKDKSAENLGDALMLIASKRVPKRGPQWSRGGNGNRETKIKELLVVSGGGWVNEKKTLFGDPRSANIENQCGRQCRIQSEYSDVRVP